jgi:hypothetical protein
MADQTFNAAEAIASLLDSAGLTAVRQLSVGRFAVLVLAFDGNLYILTIHPA